MLSNLTAYAAAYAGAYVPMIVPFKPPRVPYTDGGSVDPSVHTAGANFVVTIFFAAGCLAIVWGVFLIIGALATSATTGLKGIALVIVALIMASPGAYYGLLGSTVSHLLGNNP